MNFETLSMPIPHPTDAEMKLGVVLFSLLNSNDKMIYIFNVRYTINLKIIKLIKCKIIGGKEAFIKGYHKDPFGIFGCREHPKK